MDKVADRERFSPDYKVGLNEEQVRKRQEQGLTNVVTQRITKTNFEIIRDNVCTLFNLYNFLIAMALAFVGAFSNMFFILIILVNITIGIVQEIHAKNMVEDLSIVSSAKADVVRGKKEQQITVDELVLDDIIMLDMGKQVCADAVIASGEVEVNESLLTGEADPIIKQKGDTLLSGSFIVSGKCYAKAEHVGAENFASKLSLEAKKHKGINSELLLSMRKVTKLTSFFIIPIGIILFYQAYVGRADGMMDSIVSTAAGLLGMLPKGLVLLISISLATGIIKLSKKRILVQELYCVETLAHVDMLCLDKTGTITEGKMSVSDVFSINDKVMPLPIEEAMGCFVGGMEDNNATFMSLKDYFKEDNSKKVIGRTPFSSSRKWSSITFEGVGTLVIGAPERVINDENESLPPHIIAEQENGKRILCLGYTKESITDGKLPKLTLIAAIGLHDPIRKNVKETLEFFKEEGVAVKIISGDNPATVSSIAKEAGLETHGDYIDMSLVKDEEIEDIAKEYSVFGRVSPNQKKLLVKAYQKQGRTVAMTGDGVNDVLALKEADCSIAMAAGSDAAKQVSQLVLLDSDFTSLPDVVMEGRRVVNNVTRVSGIFFVKTIYSILLAIGCILTQTAFPFIPIQITLIDLAIEGYPSFFMSFEPVHDRIKGRFLPTAVKRALPFGLTVILSIIAISLIAPSMNLPEEDMITTMYYVLGFVSVLSVLKACMPFNKLRVFLFTTVAIGYFTAVVLFTRILHLQYLNAETFKLFAVVAAICIPVRFIFAYLIEHFPKRKGLMLKAE